MNPYDLYKALFSKQKYNVEGLELGSNIAINQWISLTDDAINVSSLMNYFFYLSPKHFYYLLFFHIRYKQIPYVKKPKSLDMSNNLLLNKVAYILGWTDRELKLNRAVLKETILKDEAYWKNQLGIK